MTNDKLREDLLHSAKIIGGAVLLGALMLLIIVLLLAL